MDRREEVLAIARRIVGPCDVVADHSWVELGLSVVLEVVTAEGTPLIVKSHNDVFRTQLEAAAYRNWVPSIAGRAPALVGEDAGSQVLVLTKLDGRAPSSDLPPSVYADAGAVLRQFHESGEELVDAGWAAQRLSNLDSWIGRLPAGLVDPEDWWIHDIQRMWWKEWADRPDLRDGFLAGYGRQLDETEVAGLSANSARGHLIQIIWATQHRDLAFAGEGRTYLAKMRLES